MVEIESGKYYRTRSGEKVGPMIRYGEGWTDPGHNDAWYGDGTQPCDLTGIGSTSIISEWIDAPKFKVGDRVRVKAENWEMNSNRGIVREFVVGEVDGDRDVWYSDGGCPDMNRCVDRREIELITEPPAFTIDWPHGHVTRDGRKARIVCTDVKGAYPIIALISEGPDEWVRRYSDTGMCHSRCNDDDILNAKAPKREWWVNVYEGGTMSMWTTKETADRFDVNRLACVHVTEGDGL